MTRCQVNLSPQQFWLAEAILPKRFVEATVIFFVKSWKINFSA